MTCASAGTGNHTGRLEDSENLVASNDCGKLARVLWTLGCVEHTADLRDTVRVTKDLANPAISSVCCPCSLVQLPLLGRSGALLRELADLLDDLLGSGLQPRRWVARVGDGRG